MAKTTSTILVSICTAFVALAQANAADHVTGRLLAQIRRGASETALTKALNTHGAAEEKRIAGIDVAVLHVPEKELVRIQDALSHTGLFTFVEPDFTATAALTANDPDYSSQWHLQKIQASSAWDITKGSTVSIAIIDSGADPTHPDLKPKLVAGWNFVLGTSNTTDTNGHGTAVAGSAAAATDNLIGVAGVAWATPIMPLAVLDSTGFASYSNIASAITYAADHGARVINISIAGSSASSVLQSAVDYAWSKGVVIFAAAGNYSTSTPYYPAACNNVLAISATEPTDAFASFSNYGTWIDFAAPGDGILTTTVGGGYASWYGTSFSSPIAAGVAALVLGVRPGLSNSALVSLLQKNSDDLGTAGYDQYYGWGRVNAYKAANAALGISGDTTPPTVKISSPLPGATDSGTVAVLGTATDNVGVSKVEFDVDGQVVSTALTPSFDFSWVTTSLSNASHTLTIKAYDAANNVGSATVSVTVKNAVVADIQPPAVFITSPANGSTVSGNVKVNVSASDNVAVSQISIYIDTVQVCHCTTVPCAYQWNTHKVSAGTHVITAKAWDPSGNMGASAPISVRK